MNRIPFINLINVLLILIIVYPIQRGYSQPTRVIKIIDPDNGPGTDYLSLQDFAYSEARNLVGLNQIAVALCRSSQGTPDLKEVTFEAPPWTTDEVHYIEVTTDSANKAGAIWNDNKYVLKVDDPGHQIREVIDGENVDIVIDGLQIYFRGTGQSNRLFDYDSQVGKAEIKNCFIITELINSGNVVVLISSNDWEVSNCILVGINAAGGSTTFLSSSSSSHLRLYNNTIMGWDRGIIAEDGGVVTAVNNIIRDANDGFKTDNGGSFSSISDYNSSNISGDAVVKSPRDNQQSPWYSGSYQNNQLFEDVAGTDFHLRNGSIFINTGQGPGANPNVPLQDIEGDIRSGNSTDLGADFSNLTSPINNEGMGLNIEHGIYLYQNYPNPFNPVTNIKFDSHTIQNDVQVNIYNVQGMNVKKLHDGKLNRGSHILKWNGTNDNGISLPSGVYFVEVSSRRETKSMKILLLR